MSTPVRIGGFVAALVAIFAVAVGAGRAAGPVEEPVAEHDGEEHVADPAADHDDAGHEEQGATKAADVPGGLMVSQDGYTLALADPVARAGRAVPVALTILGPDGEPVTEFEVEHEKRLHLIAVRRDHTGFQHVHPRLAADGTWSTTLDLTPGPWRVFADFTATGADPLTLGADLSVPGGYAPDRDDRTDRTASVEDYQVRVDGDLVPGEDSELTLSVTRDGRPVTDLQPYLGAYGHLVALRDGDLAYLHVHPDGSPGDGATDPGPDVVFYAAVPSPGRYRLYLDFKHGGVVRTAAFTLTAGPAADEPGPSDDSHGHGH